MRKKITLLVVLAVMLVSSGVLAYVSDRMDFGEIDFKGATVTYVLHHDHLADFREGGKYAGRLDEAMELFNIGAIEIVQVDWGEVGNACLNRYLAGDSTYDLWRLPHNQFFQLASRGAFFPVDTILPDEYFEYLSQITQTKNDRLRFNGRRLHFSAGVPDDYGHATFMVANLDIFERENLGDPYEMYYNGEWTWDKLEEIAIKATRDTDGDGEIDQWGLAWIEPTFMIFANGGSITRLDDNGKVVFSLGEPEAVEALRTYGEWNQKGYFVGDYQMREFMTGKAAVAVMPMWQVNQNNDWDFRFAVLPLAKGPSVDDYVFAPGVADAIFIPANAEYPLGLVALDNFLFPMDEYEETLEEWITVRAQDRESYEIIWHVLENVDGDAAYYHNFLGSWWEGETPFGGIVGGISGGAAPASVVAEFAGTAQAMIDEYLGQ